jgi:hypothetical protein
LVFIPIENEKHLNFMETSAIIDFDAFGPEGLNCSLGGENNPMNNPESRKKISIANTRKKTIKRNNQ